MLARAEASTEGKVQLPTRWEFNEYQPVRVDMQKKTCSMQCPTCSEWELTLWIRVLVACRN
jgi:hypothetical protein